MGLGLLGGPWLWRRPVSPCTLWRAPDAARGKMRAAHGALSGPCVLGDPAPLHPLGPCPRRGNSRETAGCGREGGKDGCLTSLKRPPRPGPAPHPPSGQANHGRWLRRDGRVGVQGGHEGHAQIPECACVRGGHRPSPLPAWARPGEERAQGRAFPRFAPPPALD